MTRLLKVYEIKDSGSVELGTLQTGEVTVGRDPDADLAFPSGAVSFSHGVFVRMRNHWFFKDLGSTNGSWLNDRVVAPEHWKLIRPGDVLQLADIVLKFVAADGGGDKPRQGFPALGGRTLLVFSSGEFLDEYPVPDYGKALIIGGDKADLELPGDDSFVLEKKGDTIVAYTELQLLSFSVNGQQTYDSIPLGDGDEVEVGPYLIFYNDPLKAPTGVPLASPAPGAHLPATVSQGGSPRETSTSLRPWDSGIYQQSESGRTRTQLPFGQTPPPIPSGVIDTASLDPVELAEHLKREGKLSRRPMPLDDEEEVFEGPRHSRYSLKTLEGKLLVFTGLCLVLAMICLIVYLITN